MVALAGFHIKRQEFEPEYDNEAEVIVADMEFKEDDTEVSHCMHHELFPEYTCGPYVHFQFLTLSQWWFVGMAFHSIAVKHLMQSSLLLCLLICCPWCIRQG